MKVNKILQSYKDFLFLSYNGLTPRRKALFIIYNVCLSLYMTFIFYFSYSSVFVSDILTVQVLIKSALLTILIFHLIPTVCILLKNKHFIICKPHPQPFKNTTGWFYGILCFLLLLIPFGVHFPGLTSIDTNNQWAQIQQFQFDNWHPVIHTFLLWLITRICNHYAFVILCQIMLFSGAVGYLMATLAKWGYSKKWLTVIGFFLILNPFSHGILLYMWKDTIFTILLFFLSAQLINIYLSHGQWLSSWKNIVVFSILIGLATLVRHNGLLFTFPLLFLLLIFYLKNNWKTAGIFVLMGIWIILIRGPLYSALHVTYPENTYTESVGLPMTIMGNVLVKNPQALSNTTKNFLNTMASDEEWKNNYIPGDYNSIKWLFNTANHISGVPVEDFAAMTLNTVQSDPKNSFLAIRDVTYPVWQPWGEFKSVNIFSNKESLFNETNPFRKLLKESLFAIDIIIISIPLLGEMFAKIGLQMLLLLLVGIIALYKNGSKTLLFIVPMLVYNLGTLLFLCTASDVRFFHFNAVITLPYIVVLLFNPCNTP